MNYFRKIEAACLQPALHDAIPRALALKGIAFLWIWLEGCERRKILQKRCSRCFSVSNRDSFLPCFPEAPLCHGWEAEILHPTRLCCSYSRWQLAAQLHVTSQRRTEPTVANVCSSVPGWLLPSCGRLLHAHPHGQPPSLSASSRLPKREREQKGLNGIYRAGRRALGYPKLQCSLAGIASLDPGERA